MYGRVTRSDLGSSRHNESITPSTTIRLCRSSITGLRRAEGCVLHQGGILPRQRVSISKRTRTTVGTGRGEDESLHAGVTD